MNSSLFSASLLSLFRVSQTIVNAGEVNSDSLFCTEIMAFEVCLVLGFDWS